MGWVPRCYNSCSFLVFIPLSILTHRMVLLMIKMCLPTSVNVIKQSFADITTGNLNLFNPSQVYPDPCLLSVELTILSWWLSYFKIVRNLSMSSDLKSLSACSEYLSAFMISPQQPSSGFPGLISYLIDTDSTYISFSPLLIKIYYVHVWLKVKELGLTWLMFCYNWFQWSPWREHTHHAFFY